MNLALPLWLFSEPLAPIKAIDKDYDPIVLGPIKAVPPGMKIKLEIKYFIFFNYILGFTTWDRIECNGPMNI